jgi:hypothetical protein
MIPSVLKETTRPEILHTIESYTLFLGKLTWKALAEREWRVPEGLSSPHEQS